MTAEYDFNIHIMDFQPGQYLNVKEVREGEGEGRIMQAEAQMRNIGQPEREGREALASEQESRRACSLGPSTRCLRYTSAR